VKKVILVVFLQLVAQCEVQMQETLNLAYLQLINCNQAHINSHFKLA